MAVQRGWMNAGHFYNNIVKPCKIDLNFIVDSTNGNGLGIRSLKSNGYVRNVFMNTSASFAGTTHTTTSVTSIASTALLQVGMQVTGSGITAGTTIASIVSATAITLSASTSSSTTTGITYGGFNDGAASPIPAAGYALIQLKNNFNTYLGGFNGFVSPTTSPTTAITSGLTAGNAYIISSLGTTTLAEWQSIGLPAGLTPTVGQSFIAVATGTGGAHTGQVALPSVSGILCTEVIGDPNQSISNSSIASNGGAYLLVQFLAPTLSTNAYGQPMIPTAPANNSVVGMSMFFDQSSVTVDGL